MVNRCILRDRMQQQCLANSYLHDSTRETRLNCYQATQNVYLFYLVSWKQGVYYQTKSKLDIFILDLLQVTPIVKTME